MRKLVVLGLALVLVSVGAFVVLRSDENPTSSTQSNNQTETTEQKPTTQQSEEGSYVDYNEAALAEAKGTRILFFHASWCPQCRALEADIKQQGVPAGTTIFKVDYDNAQDLRKKYGVTLQTTVVKVDQNGNLISKFTPYQKPTLENALNNL